MTITPNQIEKLKYNGNICIAGLTASGKTTHSHLVCGEFGLTYVSGSQIQLNFLGISPIQSRDFWISQEAKALWNHDQFNKIDAELLRLESISTGYIFDGSTMPWRHNKPALCIWLESDLNSRVKKSIISHRGRSNVSPDQYEELIKGKDRATIDLCNELYDIQISKDLSCFDLILDISSTTKATTLRASLKSISRVQKIISPAVGWYLTKDIRFLKKLENACEKNKEIIQKNTLLN